MAAAFPVLDYDQVHRIFTEYRSTYDTRLSSLQRELAKECAQSLLDLRELDRRVRERLAAVVAGQTPDPAALHEFLKQAASTHPQLEQWLSANPNPIPSLVARGYTSSGTGEALPGLESSEEQQLRLDTEAYYYKAHRLFTGLRLLPDLASTECKEVQVIRNQLLEHPEKTSSGVVLPSFSYTRESGPVIKGTRYSYQSDVHQDAGFYHNSRRLLEVIEQALRVAIHQAQSDDAAAAT